MKTPPFFNDIVDAFNAGGEAINEALLAAFKKIVDFFSDDPPAMKVDIVENVAVPKKQNPPHEIITIKHDCDIFTFGNVVIFVIIWMVFF